MTARVGGGTRDALASLGAPTLIFGLALALRLVGISDMEFKADEAVALELVDQFFKTGEWPQVGLVSSLGVPNPPIFVYLLAIPAAFSRDPIFVAVSIALLNGIAVLLTYVIGRRFFSREAGVIAGLLFAVSPWAIIYSRKIWAIDYLPIFTCLLLYLLLHLRERPHARAVVWLAPLLCVLWQLHFSSYLMIALVVGALLFFWRETRPHLGYLALGVGLAVANASPYLIYLTKHGTADLGKVFGSPGSSAAYSLDALRYPFDIFSFGHFEYMMGADVQHLRGSAWGSGLLALLLLIAVLHATVRVAVNARLGPPHPWLQVSPSAPLVLTLLVFVVPIIAYYVLRVRVFPHYFAIEYPAPFLLVGVFCADAARTTASRRNATRAAPAAREGAFAWSAAAMRTIAAAACIAMLLYTLGFFRLVAGGGAGNGDYGIAYRFKAAAVRDAIERAKTIRPTSARAASPWPYEYAYLAGSFAPDVGPPALRRFALYDLRDARASCSPASPQFGGRVFGPLLVCPVRD